MNGWCQLVHEAHEGINTNGWQHPYALLPMLLLFILTLRREHKESVEGATGDALVYIAHHHPLFHTLFPTSNAGNRQTAGTSAGKRGQHLTQYWPPQPWGGNSITTNKDVAMPLVSFVGQSVTTSTVSAAH